jgi:cellulose synthase (UDP-forming)
VRPPARRDAARAAPWPLPQLGRLLWAPVRWLLRLLDRVDYPALSARLERGTTRLGRLPLPLRWLILAGMAVLFWLAASTPLATYEQFLFFLALWVSALLVRRMPGDLPTLVLVGFSILASARYIVWRLTQTLGYETSVEQFLGTGLILAEAYTWVVMLLGYIQNAWPLRRQPVPMPEDRRLWPHVDVFIPSYNEPLTVVKPAIYAALGMDWPADRLHVYLLDDGRRPEFRDFCAQAGAHYMTRPDNAHAKAGNLNHALRHTQSEYVAIFDCDHVPVRSFLRNTVGWFLRDPKCAMLQTPHHFFSPDPFERNLGTFRRVPNEGNLFYGLVQDGNDLWNATFFCGSCAVIRRKPLEEVGGIAVETVTEDAHTALKMHRLGYTTAYLNMIQAAGLATESLSGHIGQRIRWARGMAQIFRTDNPMFGRGLSLFQRLCYSNGMLHFFYGIPRLVFLTAPLSYLYFEFHVISAAAATIAAYALPHLFLAELANSRMQGRYRHSFWAEVYESVLAWYITLPTTIAFINPRYGKFNVTAKGGLIDRNYLDLNIARPYLILILINFIGVGIGVGRLLFWNLHETGTVVMNLAWATYNLIMLGCAVSAATEVRQVRRTHRVPVRVAAVLCLPGGSRLSCETSDFSTEGVGLLLDQDPGLRPGTAVEVALPAESGMKTFPATVSKWQAPQLGLNFARLSVAQEAELIQCTFGRPDVWLDAQTGTIPGSPLASLRELFIFGVRGYLQLARRLFSQLYPATAPATARPD